MSVSACKSWLLRPRNRIVVFEDRWSMLYWDKNNYNSGRGRECRGGECGFGGHLRHNHSNCPSAVGEVEGGCGGAAVSLVEWSGWLVCCEDVIPLMLPASSGGREEGNANYFCEMSVEEIRGEVGEAVRVNVRGDSGKGGAVSAVELGSTGVRCPPDLGGEA
ncbi:hypothetical protein Tco_0516365 [Tanacetum coccineum]